MQQAEKHQKGKKQEVTTMFNKIAHRYDMLNHLLSLNIDKLWRKKATRLLSKKKPKKIIDLATGTADLALALAKLKPQRIDGVDISEEMLKIGKSKIKKKKLDSIIFLQQADAEALPFADETFDAASVAFGVRNFENLEKGLAEMHRVLNRGGVAVILEFTLPQKSPMRQLYNFYFNNILPTIGKLLSKSKDAYTYLPESVKKFPQNDDFLQLMKQAEFKNCTYKSLGFGIAAIYCGEK